MELIKSLAYLTAYFFLLGHCLYWHRKYIKMEAEYHRCHLKWFQAHSQLIMEMDKQSRIINDDGEGWKLGDKGKD